MDLRTGVYRQLYGDRLVRVRGGVDGSRGGQESGVGDGCRFGRYRGGRRDEWTEKGLTPVSKESWEVPPTKKEGPRDRVFRPLPQPERVQGATKKG